MRCSSSMVGSRGVLLAFWCSLFLLETQNATVQAFTVPTTRLHPKPSTSTKPHTFRLLQAADDGNDSKDSENGDVNPASPASALSPTVESDLNAESVTSDDAISMTTAAATTTSSSNEASTSIMMSQENKRILIEELGYRRKDVERLKLELIPALVAKRVKCPANLPDEWFRSQDELDQESRLRQQLEQESQFPLKVPLLGISLILFGKGLGDALISLIKVNIEFPGASLTEEFMGFPVLLIDLVCILVGASMGWWTWNNMK